MDQKPARVNRLYLLLGGLLVVVLVAGVVYGLTHRPSAAAITVLPPPPTPLPTAVPTPGPVRVYVSGAIVSPGVYVLPAGASVAEAVEAAGGPLAEADLGRINLAQIVQDQDQVHVPSTGGVAPQVGGRVNINQADSLTLQTLPGIGPAMAERIIAYRQENGPFTTVEDILNVKGIGPATLEKLRDLITVD